MSAVAKKRMSVDEFLAWSQAQGGRWELQDGEPLAMSPERVAHLETKFTVATALKAAIDRAQAPCGSGRRDGADRREHGLRA